MNITSNRRSWLQLTKRLFDGCSASSRATYILNTRAFHISNESKSQLCSFSKSPKDDKCPDELHSFHDVHENPTDAGANTESSLIQEMEVLQNKARTLTNISDFNMNSYKQVSQFIFGHDRNVSTSRKKLDDFLKQTSSAVVVGTNDNRLIVLQRELASVVLEYRKLKALHNAIMDTHGSKTSMKMSSISPSAMSSRTFTTKSTSSLSTEDSKDQTEAFEVCIYEKSMDRDSIPDQKYPKLKGEGSVTEHSYRNHLHSIFSRKQASTCSIHPYWNNALLSIRKPSARVLIYQLDPTVCPMGFAAASPTASRKGTLLSFVREEKQKFPDHVVLTRVGEFYETYGVDAIMLVEHCGLNAMGGKARAGCPVQNLQATLNCLVSAGFRVAVYEESDDVVTTGQIKNRFLAQFVSSSNPTYMYNSVLDDSSKTSDNLFGTPYSRPHMGVINTAAGYTLVEISLEEQKVRVMERLTAEAVACQLSNNPPADPLFYIPSPLEGKVKSNLPFLPSWWGTERDVSHSKSRMSILRPSVHLSEPSDRTSDVERAKDAILNHLLKTTEVSVRGEKGLSSNNFTLISPSIWSKDDSIETSPLYADTASQLGLMDVPTIPSLHKFLLPDSAPTVCSRFLRRWLLTPPPSSVAAAMSQLVGCIKNDDYLIFPEFDLAPIGKVLQYIRAGEAGAQVFWEIVRSLKSTVDVIDTCSNNDLYIESVLSPWMKILRYESGLDATPDNLKNRCLDAIQIIETIVDIDNLGTVNEDFDMGAYIDSSDVIPSKFFYNNEKQWKGRVKQDVALEAYKSVDEARLNLIDAVALDFLGLSGHQLDASVSKGLPTSIFHDIFNNLINLKSIPAWAKHRELYYHPRDRNGKILHNRYTTRRVEEALSRYIDMCQEATHTVTRKLKELSVILCDTGHLPSISQSAHSNLILATIHHHCKHANDLGWSMAEVVVTNSFNNISSSYFDQLTPYWMDRSVAVSNSFVLDGMVVLSSPNMAGKSTIMRSTAAAALLSVCGFCSPVGPGTKIRKFDHLFVRGASADVPSENKSAFGAEMGDVAALLRVCGNYSLVFVDELGRGTSPKDGTSLAAAILENMAEKKMSGFFATHLHSIVELPLRECNIVYKQMGTTECGEEWTYKLIDGVCRESKALKTASKFGIPAEIISRAKVLAEYLDETATFHERKFKNSLPSNLSMAGHSQQLHDDFFRAREMLNKITEQEPIVIPPNFSVPAAYEGVSCVYVLHTGSSFYIGETDHISQRIRKHRQSQEFRNATIMIVKIPHGKTESRNIESRLIQRYVQDGIKVLSTKDGSRISPSKFAREEDRTD